MDLANFPETQARQIDARGVMRRRWSAAGSSFASRSGVWVGGFHVELSYRFMNVHEVLFGSEL